MERDASPEERCEQSPPEQSGGLFPNTRWSLVQEISTGGEDADRALGELCTIYWYPVYAYLRSSGARPADAEDLTQGFFARLIGKELFSRADSTKGRLRCFLLNALKHFKIDEFRKSNAEKRGGRTFTLSIDSVEAEERFRFEPADTQNNPELVFERRWALALLEQAFEQLKADYEKSGKLELYQVLQPYVTGEVNTGKSYSDAAETLGMSDGAVQVAVHRLRKRYRLALEAAIAETVESPDEIEHELEQVLSALSP